MDTESGADESNMSTPIPAASPKWSKRAKLPYRIHPMLPDEENEGEVLKTSKLVTEAVALAGPRQDRYRAAVGEGLHAELRDNMGFDSPESRYMMTCRRSNLFVFDRRRGNTCAIYIV